jgi:hypothetical protein
MTRKASPVWLAAAMLLGAPHAARAQTPAAADDATARGRAAYVKGVQLSHDQQWGDALAAFQEAASLRDHPQVEVNIAYCERALGRYVAARRTLLAVLAQPTGLDATQLNDSRSYLA